MRGYRILKSLNSLNRLTEVNRSLTTHSLDLKEEWFSKHLFGKGWEQAETVCRQYLLTRVAGVKLNSALLHSLGKGDSSVAFYLPPQWRQVLRKHGFNIATFSSKLTWNVYLVMMLGYGILKIIQIITESIKATLSPSNQQLGKYAYFNALASTNLPNPSSDGHSHDIVSWYAQWHGGLSDVNTFCHSVKDAEDCDVNGIPVVTLPNPIPPLTNYGAIFRFIGWSVLAIIVAILDLLRGRWWHAFLLNQAALAAQVRMQKHDLLAKDYLFHNSNWIYRPLWTYEAEKLGSRIIFYFYSTNCESFKQLDHYPPMPYGWQTMAWPLYLVWDQYQADFIRRAVGKTANISVVGQIWFNCCAEDVPRFENKCIAVFDVTPFRSSKYRTLGLDFEYYLPETCNAFLNDILITATNVGATMLWKRKREIGSNAHPRYRFYANRITECSNVALIDPDISANRLIEKCAAVISMPFTSTALIARELGKPSCYYDPSGLVQKDDRAAHGIPIITGPDELADWLKAV